MISRLMALTRVASKSDNSMLAGMRSTPSLWCKIPSSAVKGSSRMIFPMTVARVVCKLSWSCQPRQVVRSPWGSASMSRTFFPRRAKPMPRFTVVVVLPVPPFWLASAITRLSLGRLLCSGIFMSSFFIDLAARWQDGRLCMRKIRKVGMKKAAYSLKRISGSSGSDM